MVLVFAPITLNIYKINMFCTKFLKFNEIRGFELGSGVFNTETINGRIVSGFDSKYSESVVTFLNEYETKFSPRFGRIAHSSNLASAYLYPFLTHATTVTECLISLRRSKTVVTIPIINAKFLALIAKRVNISTISSGRVTAVTEYDGHFAASIYFNNLTLSDVEYLKSNTYFKDCIKSEEDSQNFLAAVKHYVSSVLVPNDDGTVSMNYQAAFNCIEKATHSLNFKWETTTFVAEDVDSSLLGFYRFRGDFSCYRASREGIDSLSQDTLSCYLCFLTLFRPNFVVIRNGFDKCTSGDCAVPGDVFFYPKELSINTVWKIAFSFFTINLPNPEDGLKRTKKDINGGGKTNGLLSNLTINREDRHGAARNFSSLPVSKVVTKLVCGYNARLFYVGDKITLLPPSIYLGLNLI